MERVVLSLGSNLGDRLNNLDQALFLLGENLLSENRKIFCSDVFKTEALLLSDGKGASKPDYLNCAIAFDTEHSAREVLEVCQKIEAELGRNREEEVGRYDSRLIDIDIIFFGEHSVNEEDLEIPHPRFHNRGFMLIPVMQVAGHFVHPKFGKAVRYIVKELENDLEVEFYAEAASFSLAAIKLEDRSGR
jgi:2-amino-4-hydroxy-6-hydroxymethyldihydropteridine pyrophosphokinase